MFTLFYGLWKSWFKRDEFFVLIVGLDNAGKSTFLEQAKIQFDPKHGRPNSLRHITTTVGLNIGRLQTDGIVINFWDLGGQRELQTLWNKYYAETHGIIYVIDSSDRDRLEESRLAFDSMIRNVKLAKLPLLVVANKNDVSNAITLDQLQQTFDSDSIMVSARKSHFVSCSALNGNGVKDSISWMADCIKQNIEVRPPHNVDD